mmetsp:Transcript_8904/g.20322  ORF Transcript_8904/g.20322 Transcript_8904/m.20322 type:complete len:99 (-) Transcript_8904:55-351(-)
MKRSKTKKSVDGAHRATTGDVTANLHLQHPESNFSLTGISALVYLRGLLGDLVLSLSLRQSATERNFWFSWDTRTFPCSKNVNLLFVPSTQTSLKDSI